jgi:hypothetical protein
MGERLGGDTINDPSITIETSCGQVFELRASELSDRQLAILLDENGEQADVDPTHIAAMQAELQRREDTQRVPTCRRIISTNTYRDLVERRLIDAIAESVGGSPWDDEFEEAIDAFIAKFRFAIASVPDVAKILEKPLTRDANGCDGVDAIGPIPWD